MASGQWLTVEPTPGYEVLRPPPGYMARALEVALAAGIWVREHAVLTVMFVIVVACGWRYRWTVLDCLATTWWRVVRHRALRRDRPRLLPLATWRLVEKRLAWSGLRRPLGMTVREWLAASPFQSAADGDFVLLLEWAAFSKTESPLTTTDVAAVCERMVVGWSLSRLGQTSQSARSRHGWRVAFGTAFRGIEETRVRGAV
ncbi:MAG: hypothetical protein R3B90_13845 [Planctomycetaceae bacterium]